MPSNANVSKPSTRERLLAAADDLFYREGVKTVGIDRIVQQAGVAKASLYNLFGSKDELVEAYLDARHAGTRDQVERALTRFRTPRERLLGVFDAQGQLFTEPDFTGCAHMTAARRPSTAAPSSVPPTGTGCGYGPPSRTWRRRPASPTPRAWHGSCTSCTTAPGSRRGWTGIRRRRRPLEQPPPCCSTRQPRPTRRPTPASTTTAPTAASETAAPTPLGRAGHPDEVAATALYLAGNQSSFTTGAELLVDGGTTQL